MPIFPLGAHIDFSAAVWSTRPNVQVLSTALPLFWHHTNTRMCAMAARHFGVLRIALRSLEQCYDEELSNKMPPTRLIPNLEVPYPLSYICINTSLIRISDTYLIPISHGRYQTTLYRRDSRRRKDLCQVCPSLLEVRTQFLHFQGLRSDIRRLRGATRWMAHGHYGDDCGRLLPPDRFPSSLCSLRTTSLLFAKKTMFMETPAT